MANLASQTASFMRSGMENDIQRLVEWGIDPQSAAATRYYVRWTREDLTGVFHMVAEMHDEMQRQTRQHLRQARLLALLLALIAMPLWIIALR